MFSPRSPFPHLVCVCVGLGVLQNALPGYILSQGQQCVSPAKIDLGKGLPLLPELSEASSTNYPAPCTVQSVWPYETWGAPWAKS